METTEVRISGGSVFWSIGNTNRDALKAGLEAAAYAGFVPGERTPKAILQDALTDLYATATRLVRPLQKQDAMIVVNEDRGQDTNDYTPALRAEVKDGEIEVIPADKTDEVVAAYKEFRGVLPGHSVAASLVGIVSALNGLTLRPSGGFYWLPSDKLAEWEKVARAVERAAVEPGKSKMWVMRTAMDEDTMRAVRDSVAADLGTRISEIEAEVMEGELGERALLARAASARELRKKLGEYEAMLGSAMEDLRDKLNTIDTVTGAAALQVSASAVASAQKAVAAL